MAIRQILVLKFMTKLHYDFPKILNLSLCSKFHCFTLVKYREDSGTDIAKTQNRVQRTQNIGSFI